MKVKLKRAQVGMKMEIATIGVWQKKPGEALGQGEA